MNITDVIIAPIISEKSMKEAMNGRFTFKVAKNAGKEDIKKAVEDKFKVNVVSVSTMTVKGKTRRFGTRRIETALSVWKKAITQLKTGEKIDLFEVPTQG